MCRADAQTHVGATPLNSRIYVDFSPLLAQQMQDTTAELKLRERSSGQSALDTVAGAVLAEHARKHDDSQQVYSEVWERMNFRRALKVLPNVSMNSDKARYSKGGKKALKKSNAVRCWVTKECLKRM